MPSLDTTMSYHRLKRAPLDDMEVFNNLRELMDYCNNGARYDGQRVVVLNGSLGSVEYNIKNNIPIINMRGSEPIFKSITFSGDSSATHGLLIYENNLGGIWGQNEVFTFNESKLCMLNQLEIFRILDAAGNKTFKFYMERQTRDTDTVFTRTWSQNYNPYLDGSSNSINGASSGATINELSFNASANGWLKTTNSSLYLMPRTNIGITEEDKYITKIYVKAEDYYQALI
jgi:hypothetical protein